MKIKIKDIIDLKGCYSARDVGEKEIEIPSEEEIITALKANGALDNYRNDYIDCNKSASSTYEIHKKHHSRIAKVTHKLIKERMGIR